MKTHNTPLVSAPLVLLVAVVTCCNRQQVGKRIGGGQTNRKRGKVRQRLRGQKRKTQQKPCKWRNDLMSPEQGGWWCACVSAPVHVGHRRCVAAESRWGKTTSRVGLFTRRHRRPGNPIDHRAFFSSSKRLNCKLNFLCLFIKKKIKINTFGHKYDILWFIS